MIGAEIKDAYKGQIRTGTVIEDLDTHWRVDWGPNKTKIRKDRVGKRPKRQGPWWPNPPESKATECRSVDLAAVRKRVRMAAAHAKDTYVRDQLTNALHEIDGTWPETTDCGSVDVPPVMPADGSPLPVLTGEMLDRLTESADNDD